MPSISPDALSILSDCLVDSEARTVTLQCGELPRALYEEVDDVLQRIGGKWSKGKLKAHQFPYDPGPLLRGVIASGEQPPKNPTAFYPTPKEVVDNLIQASELSPYWSGARILEPSAGTGAIARAIREQMAPDAVLHCCEFLGVNRSVLETDGFELVADDFTKYQPEERYDVIIMNPPFSVDTDKTAYITHIEHAWSMLSYGGRLAAIVPGGWLYGSTKRVAKFREFVCDYLNIEEIGSGAFKESGTMVNTYMIYGESASGPWRQKPHNGWPSYHAWHASLWFDNDFELYQSLRRAKTREQFNEACRQGERQLVSKELVPVILSDSDIDALWRFYRDEEPGS